MGLNTIKFAAIFLVILVVYPLIGFELSLNHLYLPFVLLAQFTFMIGVMIFLSSLTPFFPDMGLIISHLLRLAMYPSGVLFSIESVPEKYKFLITYNPMAQSIDSFRKIVMYQSPPNFQGLIFLFFVGGLLYIFGILLIRKFDGIYAKSN